MERYSLVASLLQERASPNLITVRDDFLPATMSDALLIHDKAFMTKFCRGDMTLEEKKRIGLPWSYDLVRRTFRITGATIAATLDVVVHGHPCAGNLAGGTHHAFANVAEGYCIQNDIAVSARVAQRHAIKQLRVIVVDLDVHQGNGTAAIFKDDDDVFTFSLHAEKNYPWDSRRPSDLDIGVPDDVSGSAYLQRVEEGLSTIEERALDPSIESIVFFQAGVDPLASDPLADSAYREMI